MGGVSRRTHSATLPPDRFYCLLEELPLHLVPHRTLRSLRVREEQRPLFLNPECVFCSGDEIPRELADHSELVSGFALQGTIAWIRKPPTGECLPFWLGPKLESLLRSLDSNNPAPPLSAELTALLTTAGILISDTRVSERDEDSMMQSRRLFQEKGYAPRSNLIHPFHIAALRRYYRYLIRTGAIALGDRQSSRRYFAHNEPVARFFHHQMAATVSKVVGEPLKPSYVYFASYLSGAELKKHCDREQCEFSVTLCLDFSPEPTLETQWPIRLDTATGTVAVYQALGDGLVYRGTQLPHYRDRLGEGQTSTSMFFHYVGADFEGSLD